MITTPPNAYRPHPLRMRTSFSQGMSRCEVQIIDVAPYSTLTARDSVAKSACVHTKQLDKEDVHVHVECTQHTANEQDRIRKEWSHTRGS